MSKILIIEDEPEMVLGLKDNFELEGYEVAVAYDGESGIALATTERPHLIILDVMLPKVSGLDVCRRLRAEGFTAPILMLTARGQEADKVAGLEIGADDYITKPFGLSELLARVRAHLRRSARPSVEPHRYAFGAVEIDFVRYEAQKNGAPLALSPREFEILKYFVLHRGEAVTRDQLLNDVWGYSRFVFTRTVDNHIAKLRHKIEDDPDAPKWILTIHRVGYRFLG
jgi:two-component system alkaline phosphatase synthesis response regulator PhoP